MLHLFTKVPSKLSTILIAFDAGARAESDKYSMGLAHMMEHMIFKSTSKRDYKQIAKDIAFLGGSTNAFTSTEMVCFYISVPNENIDAATEILSDIVFNSTIPDAEFQKEREVVREEALSSQDSVDSFVWDSFAKDFFTDRLSDPIIGTQESIDAFSQPELVKFYEKFYKKSNCLVSLCGDMSKKNAKALLTKYFGKSTNKFSLQSKVYEPVYKAARTLEIYREQLEHSYVWLGFPGSRIDAENKIAEDIAFSILGHGMDSRLFMEIREKHGLAYSIGASNQNYRDCGANIIYSSTRTENVDKMIDLINMEITRLKTELVDSEELERAKNKYRAQIYAVTESSHAMAKTNLSKRFFSLSPFSELPKQINDVTVEQVLEAANKCFDETKRLTLICKEGK